MEAVSIDRVLTQPRAITTRQGHYGRLTYLVNHTGQSIMWIMRNPDAVVKWMKENIGNNEKGEFKPASLATYSISVCKLFTIHDEFKQRNMTAYKRWGVFARAFSKMRVEQYENNTLSQQQIDNMVPSEDIKRIFCPLGKSEDITLHFKLNLHHLLFGMFLNIKPKRSDLGNVYVSLDGLIPKSYTKANYIHLNAKQPFLMLHEYKTAKIYGVIKEPLNPVITGIIKESIRMFPRDHLFGFTRAQGQQKQNDKAQAQQNQNDEAQVVKPYVKNDSYSKFVRRAFEHHFGKTMGVSLWRRVYVGENVDFTLQTYKEMKDNARLSGQSVLTQLIIYKPAGVDGPIKRKIRELLGKPVHCNN